MQQNANQCRKEKTTITETKFDKLPAKQWIEKFARGEEAKWTG